ncbi:MAG: hypothetical protein RIS84_1904, partial [Pseudomonadota bacterium]
GGEGWGALLNKGSDSVVGKDGGTALGYVQSGENYTIYLLTRQLTISLMRHN